MKLKGVLNQTTIYEGALLMSIVCHFDKLHEMRDIVMLRSYDFYTIDIKHNKGYFRIRSLVKDERRRITIRQCLNLCCD